MPGTDEDKAAVAEDKVVIYSSPKPSLNFSLDNGKKIQFKNGVYEARGNYIKWMQEWLDEAPPSSRALINTINVDKAREIAEAHSRAMGNVAAQGPMSSMSRGKQAEQARLLTEASRVASGGTATAQETLKQLSTGMTAGEDPSFVRAETVAPEKPAVNFSALIMPKKAPVDQK